MMLSSSILVDGARNCSGKEIKICDVDCLRLHEEDPCRCTCGDTSMSHTKES
jgi:hypothetical protein